MLTQAVILCAGLGTRLRPLTDMMPKQMIPIGGKPLLEHLLVHLRDQGVQEFFINLHYMPDAIPAYFGNGEKWGVKIIYAKESPAILGTAGGIKNFESQLNDEFFVMYGDMWNKIDFRKLYEFHRSKGDAAGTVIVAKADRMDVDMVELDDQHRFQQFYYRPYPADYRLEHKLLLNAIYVFSKKILQLIPAHAYFELDKQVLPQMLEQQWPLYGYATTEPVIDVGTFDRLRKIRQLVEEDQL